MRLLLVVDGALVRSAYCAVLSGRRFLFDVASSPADGLMRAHRTAYDAIIAEVDMAGMSGLDFLKAIRKFDLDIPVVLMTDGPPGETATPAVEDGVCRYVSKSVGIDVLEKTLRRAGRWRGFPRPHAGTSVPDGGMSPGLL